jgi:hypothetical protein
MDTIMVLFGAVSNMLVKQLHGDCDHSQESRYLHCASAEDSNEHEFLPRAEVELEEFWDRYDDNVDVDGDVVARGDEPENGLIDAVVIRCFVVPGCPCTCEGV